MTIISYHVEFFPKYLWSSYTENLLNLHYILLILSVQNIVSHKTSKFKISDSRSTSRVRKFQNLHIEMVKELYYKMYTLKKLIAKFWRFLLKFDTWLLNFWIIVKIWNIWFTFGWFCYKFFVNSQKTTKSSEIFRKESNFGRSYQINKEIDTSWWLNTNFSNKWQNLAKNNTVWKKKINSKVKNWKLDNLAKYFSTV